MSEIQNQNEAWKAARARIAAAAIKPPVSEKKDAPAPTRNTNVVRLVPPSNDVSSETMDIIIAAVGVGMDLPVNEVLSGQTPDHVSARKLSLGLCVRLPRLPIARVADHFEVNEEAVRESLFVLDPILNEYAISAKTPLCHTMPLLVREWKIRIEDRRRKVSIREIQDAVCRVWGISRDDLRAKRRPFEVNEARQVAFTICRKLTLKSYPDIGKEFNRDHTTVLYGAQKYWPVIEFVAKRIPSNSTAYDWALAVNSQKETNIWPRKVKMKETDIPRNYPPVNCVRNKQVDTISADKSGIT